MADRRSLNDFVRGIAVFGSYLPYTAFHEEKRVISFRKKERRFRANMGDNEQPDRLLSEKELIRLAKERFGLTASKVIQMITDCPEASAMQVRIPGEPK